MTSRIRNRPPLDRQGVALRHLCAAVPMLFYGAALVAVVAQDGDRLVPALVDAAMGVAGLVLMNWRRRWPWQIALATALLTAYSTTATGPALVAYVSLCTHRRWRQIVPIAAVSWLCVLAQSVWYGFGQATAVSLVTATTVLGGLTVFGLYLRGRRDLFMSRLEAARQADRAHRQMIERAKLAERAKIAHEMHDILAHRLSLLAMLAGGLAYRTDLGSGEARAAAQAIQENAHQSLNELRAVLGTLRPGGAPEAPQPSLAQLEELFEEVRAAGQEVEVTDSVQRRELLPAQTGRHAYRIVQEALTNARKHAPGRPVAARLSGRPGEGLTIRVSNPVAFEAMGGPGGRLGLVGLAERTRMAGGTIGHGLQDGHFVLEARLPWEA